MHLIITIYLHEGRKRKKTKNVLKTQSLRQTRYYTFQRRVDLKSSNSDDVIITFQNTSCSWSLAKASNASFL